MQFQLAGLWPLRRRQFVGGRQLNRITQPLGAQISPSIGLQQIVHLSLK